jgi:hypothetical protein
VAEEQYKNKVDGAVGTSGQKKWPYCVFVLIGILLALFGQGLRKELSLPSASLYVCVRREIEEKSEKRRIFARRRDHRSSRPCARASLRISTAIILEYFIFSSF